ncbi:molecular chaperone DnaJ [Kaarinaea lacus]
MERDYYEVLGVARDADTKAIKNAYHRLAMKFHPDRNPDPDAAEKFKEISKAYAILSDPKKRANYDARGFEGVSQYSQDDLYRDLDLGAIFGDAGFGFGGGGIFDQIFGRRSTQKPKGQDLSINIQVPLDIISTGGKEKIRFSRPTTCGSCHGYGTKSGKPPPPCRSCNGTGRKVISQNQGSAGQEHIRYQQIIMCPDCRGRGTLPEDPCRVCHGSGRIEKIETLKVNIPAGVDEGTTLRVSGHGLPAEQSGVEPGDLFVHVYSAPDSRFQRRGADLWRLENISITDAVLGKKIKVPTLEGHAQVKVPPGTQPDEILRLRNKGLPKFGSSGRGDINLRIQVEIPKSLTEKQRQMYESLRRIEEEK